MAAYRGGPDWWGEGNKPSRTGCDSWLLFFPLASQQGSPPYNSTSPKFSKKGSVLVSGACLPSALIHTQTLL